ncbi:MAG: endoglucanase [Actinomycetota bacterium]|jgi:aryl-phospho-beta-D-glucosidase BglC (GH1 family)
MGHIKKSLRRVALIGMVVAALGSIIATAPAQGASKGDGKFHVYGRNVVGPDGNPVVFRGVNKGGLEYSANGYDEEMWNYQRMKSWGANFVRVAVADNFALKTMCSYDRNYIKTIDRIVSIGEQLKMLIMLDDHIATKGLTCGRNGWASNQKMPDARNVEFLKMLGTRYKNRPYVAIDLYNEPHQIGWDTWRKGGVVDGYKAVGMQQLLDTVRGTGFKGVVFATGVDWGNDLRGIADTPLANDTNVIYAAHSYPFWCDRAVGLNEAYRCKGKQYPAFLDTQIAPAINKGRPVMITEFGTPRSNDGEMRSVLQWAEDHHIGYAAWLWCNGKMTDFCLLTPDGKNTPSVSGKPVQDFLFKANGWKSLNGK